MRLNRGQEELLNEKTAKLLELLWGNIYEVVQESKNPNVEHGALMTLFHILDMAPNIHTPVEGMDSQEAYHSYLTTVCGELGYREADAKRTDPYKYADNVRKIFKADKAFLESDFIKLHEKGALPTQMEIHNSMYHKFKILSEVFSTNAATEVYKQTYKGIDNFVLSMIKNVFLEKETLSR